MSKKVRYKSKEYNEAYKNNQIANSYDKEADTYEYSLPEVSVNIRDNLNLGQVVRNGTSKVAKPLIRAGEVMLDFTPLSPALATGKVLASIDNYNRTGNSNSLKYEISNAMLEALPYINVKTLKLPLKESDNLIKTITKEKYGIDKISLSTPKKGVIADIELSPSNELDFGKKWMRPEFINVVESEQGKGLSNVLYNEGIKHAKSKGYNGVISGEVLLQPEKTIRTQRRFNGPQMKHFVEEYNYPIKGLESAKDPNLADTIINMYNKSNEYRSTVGREFYNMIRSLVK